MSELDFIEGLKQYYDGANIFEGEALKKWKDWICRSEQRGIFKLVVRPLGKRPSIEEVSIFFRANYSSPLAKALS